MIKIDATMRVHPLPTRLKRLSPLLKRFRHGHPDRGRTSSFLRRRF